MQIWIRGERAQRLHGSFSKLKVLSLNGIFLGCDLMWTMVLLESAPNLEALNIQVLIYSQFLYFASMDHAYILSLPFDSKLLLCAERVIYLSMLLSANDTNAHDL